MSQPIVLISIEQLQTIIDQSLAKLIPLITSQYLESTTKPSLPIYLSRKDTCKLLQITFPTLSKYTNKGALKAYYMGRRVLYLHDEVIAATMQPNNLITSKKKAA